MKFGPGVMVPYTGEPPRFTRRPAGEWWRCHRCNVTVPAGFIPFPHGGDCPPGLLLHVLDDVDLALEEIAWDWPVSYTAEGAQQPVSASEAA